MPGDPFRKVQPGEPLAIPAEAWNTVMDATDAWRNNRLNQGTGGIAAPLGGLPVRNTAISPLERFSVVSIQSPPLINPVSNLVQFQNRPALTAAFPAADKPIAILLEPLPTGAIGQAQVFGVAPVQIDLVEDSHTHARPIANDPTKLRSATDGPAEILAIDRGSTGVKWALVRLMPTASGTRVRTGQLAAVHMDEVLWYPPPTDLGYNVYPMRLVTGTFVQTAGEDQPAFVPDNGVGAEPDLLVGHTSGGYLPDGTVCNVFEDNGFWWTDHQSQEFEGELLEPLGDGYPYALTRIKTTGDTWAQDEEIDVGWIIGGLLNNLVLPAGTTILFRWNNAGGWTFSGTLTQAAPEQTFGWFIATAGWTWTVGKEGAVGECEGHVCDDIDGTNPGEDTVKVYVRATPARDPNIQPDQIVPWHRDANNLRIAGEGGLDDKIGMVKEFNGTEIPGGWKLWDAAKRRFTVGYDETSHVSQYGTIGNTGGSHPIRPTPHSSSEPTEETPETNTWHTDPDTGDWHDTVWAALVQGDTELAYTGITTTVEFTGSTGGGGTDPTGPASGTTGDANVSIGDHSLSISIGAHGHTVDVAVDYAPSGIAVDDHTGYSTDTTGLSVSGSAGDANPATTGAAELGIDGTVTVEDYAGDTGPGGAGSGEAEGSTDLLEIRSIATDGPSESHNHSLTPIPAMPHIQEGETEITIMVGGTIGDESNGHFHTIPSLDHSHTFSGITIDIAAHTHDATHGHVVSDTLAINPASHSHGMAHVHTVYASIDPDPHDHGIPLMGHTVIEPNAGLGHTHGASGVANLGGGFTYNDTLTHSVTPHSHSVGEHTHTGPDHSHSMDHTHDITDLQHKHAVNLPLQGELRHREEDFRPPYLVVAKIIRVGPDED